MSPDPAFKNYFPIAPIGHYTNKGNKNLPGEGGVFNSFNLAPFDYSYNNPVRYRDPTGMEGQAETGTDFPVLRYIDEFHNADYAYQPHQPKGIIGETPLPTMSAAIHVHGLELLGRLLPTGMGEEKSDALIGALSNIVNPDTYVSVSGWIRTDPTKTHILAWGVSVSIPKINESTEAAGAAPLEWHGTHVTNAEEAKKILLANPGLMARLVGQTRLPQPGKLAE